MRCDDCLQFITQWDSHVVPKNFFCERPKGHKGKHRYKGKVGISYVQDQSFSIEWEKIKKR
jgi:hypothetical protein